MNFLLRSAQPAASELPPVIENNGDANPLSKPVTTLEGLISEDPFPRYDASEDNGEADGVSSADGIFMGTSSTADVPVVDKHSDVSEDEGWITIPCKELPSNWNDTQDIRSLRSLDRSFVFPGEQVHIMACLSASGQETEIITPFRVAAVMSKNGIKWSPKKENGSIGGGMDLVPGNAEVHEKQDKDRNGESPSGKSECEKDIFAGESLLRKEGQKLKTETLLRRFNNSHFFVRICESGEKLWSKKGVSERSLESYDTDDQVSASTGTAKTLKDSSCLSAVIDKGNFKANASGGVARDAVQCCALANGDVVVLLQINVGVDLLRDPVLEILQFEKYQVRGPSLENREDAAFAKGDPCRELLTWLLPLENTVLPPVRPLSPPNLVSGIGSTSQRSNFSAASGSQIFSFGNFRSYSMSSIPQNTVPPPTPSVHSSKSTSLDLDDWERSAKQKPVMSKKTGKEGLLSFRTVSLEPERFSVRCGLEGIYTPGRRWRRKLEIIQPIEIQSFTADCNTDDFLCVQIKNVSPAHVPDIVIYIDAITIVLEESAKGGPPISFPIASIEPGDGHSLPNLALRRGEEHSFIIKPAISAWKKSNAQDRRSAQSSSSQILHKNTSSLRVTSKIVEEKNVSTMDHYAIMVSCRSNYTESRLFFKQPTSWRPRISRDIMISVASEMSREPPGPNTIASQLPVQVLTLQASNMTSEDLTMTILAPASFTSPPSVVSLNSSPSSPISPLMGITEFSGKYGNSMQKPLVAENQKKKGTGERRSVSFDEQGSPLSDAIQNTDLGCTHLWLQSRVPLGRVPSRTTATIKLELLPLTDGIITLDTLQINVKEKGRTYIPEQSLKINATSSISTGIL